MIEMGEVSTGTVKEKTKHLLEQLFYLKSLATFAELSEKIGKNAQNSYLGQVTVE